jgi:hypothetical protein
MNSFNYPSRRLLRGLLLGLLFTLISALSTAAQNKLTEAETKSDEAQQKAKSAIQKGTPLSHVSSTDVTGNISVEATLIPASVARTVFGKEIANNYAVIGLVVSNRSSDQAFIVHSIFFDYSQWLLSGGSPFLEGNNLCLQGTSSPASSISNNIDKSTTTTPPPGGNTADGSQQPKPESATENGTALKPQPAQSSSSQNCTGNPLQTWQTQTLPNQIASVESRIVREELLIEQNWTVRNWVLRGLQAAGSIATGFTFATSSESWIHGIGAFNGSVIPAYQQLWPDPTVNQMNQISNVGFQVNKAIAKQSSDIIVAFFPIDRFLTPDLKSLFISSPAAFFSPIEALLDRNTQKKVAPYLDQLFGAKDRQGKDIPGGKDNEDKLFGNLLKFLPQVQSGACLRENQDNSVPLDQSQLTAYSSVISTNQDQSASPAKNNLQIACLTAALINRLSLNTVRVIVGGTMTVDVNNVPPQIASVDIEPPSGQTTSTMWTLKSGATNATLNGTIHGSFLGGGTPALVSPPNGVTIKAVAQGSNDSQLLFTLTLTSSLPSGTKSLSFQVSKSSASGSTIKSATYDYEIEQAAPTPAAAPAPAAENGKGEAPKPAAPSSSEKPAAPTKQ